MERSEDVGGQRVVGIIGGLGPESTVDYYRGIIAEHATRVGVANAPAIVMTSLDPARMLSLFAAARFAEAVEYIGVELERLHRAGADFAVIAANTPHILFDDLVSRSPLPLLSIVDAVGEAAKTAKLTRLGLFGTRFTIEASFYPDTLARLGIAVIRPSAAEVTFIHDRYVGELLKNVFLPETRDRMLEIAARLRDDDGIDGLILGGTELPLLLRGTAVAEVTMLDSSLIHIRAIVDRLLA